MGEDYFRELGLEGRLDWSDECLQEGYDRRCRELHPDAGGDSESFQRLQRALRVVRSPGQRLRHWLDLGGIPEAGGGELEAGVGEQFEVLGPLLQRAEGVVKRLRGARSALARSMAEREAVGLLGELQAAREETRSQIERLRGRFGEFGARGAAGCGVEASRTARSLMFLEKWERQLRERWAELVG